MVGSALWIIKPTTPRAQPEGEGLYNPVHVPTMSHLIYILIHPCILGNRGVITKILTSSRHL